MFKGIDWQMTVFVGISLLQEYISFIHLPRVYFWSEEGDDTDRNRAA
ncbi:hypothetical protein [Bacillus solitudinis]|nr:hypothetical protein [Bacillus solitudinis]